MVAFVELVRNPFGSNFITPVRLRTSRGTLAVVHVPDVQLDGVSLDLPRLQARLLVALLEAATPLTTSELGARVWLGATVLDHTIHSQLAILRGRIADLGLRICNLRGRGYVIRTVVDVEGQLPIEPQIDLR
jgi:DNA-binding winged helix-turn-helix (wHTH) protein